MKITSQFKFNRVEEKSFVREDMMDQLFERQVIKGILKEVQQVIKVDTDEGAFDTTMRAELYVLTRDQVVSIWETITALGMTQKDKEILYNLLNQ